MYSKYIVFDVESVGIHGEGFAVGFVVMNADGSLVEEGMYSCRPAWAAGTVENLCWVKDNIPALPINCSSPKEVRGLFWKIWLKYKSDTVMVADCAWPVETRFLNTIVGDDFDERQWHGPYPLLDLSSILFAIGEDPLTITERLPSELPAHNPLNDARQSARQLTGALKKIKK